MPHQLLHRLWRQLGPLRQEQPLVGMIGQHGVAVVAVSGGWECDVYTKTPRPARDATEGGMWRTLIHYGMECCPGRIAGPGAAGVFGAADTAGVPGASGTGGGAGTGGGDGGSAIAVPIPSPTAVKPQPPRSIALAVNCLSLMAHLLVPLPLTLNVIAWSTRDAAKVPLRLAPDQRKRHPAKHAAGGRRISGDRGLFGVEGPGTFRKRVFNVA
jgi:hypothetical protein